MNNLCVAHIRGAYRRVSFAGQRVLRGYAHAHACIPRHSHEFSIIQIGFSYWVRAGGSRSFSLSIGRGFPAKLFSPPKVTNSPSDPWETLGSPSRAIVALFLFLPPLSRARSRPPDLVFPEFRPVSVENAGKCGS